VPTQDAIDTKGLDLAMEHLKELLKVDIKGWKDELPLIKEHYATFGEKLPEGLKEELSALEKRLG
jgi:phosphoenolpyruvate carboxykinase (GTP)